MTPVLWGFAVLVAGAIGSIVLLPWARVALGVALSATAGAGLLFVSGGLYVLLGSVAACSTSFQWSLPLGSVRLTLDALSAWFLLPIGIVSVAAAMYSWGYFRDSRQSAQALGPLLCLLVCGIALSVCAADVPLFFLGWELMSLSAFLLVGFHHRDREARNGAWMYLISTHLGTAFGVLPLLGILVASTGSTSFASFDGALNNSGAPALLGLFILGYVGFGTKAGLMPMHVWLPAAHPVAPSPVSALMSGVVIKTGIYGFLRTLTWLPPLPIGCSVLLITTGAITGVMGIVYALPQRQYKRMLAYSSVENMGIIAIGIGVGMLGRTLHLPALAALGFAGALLHVLNHSLFKGLLFLSAGAVLHGTGIDTIERLGGLAKRDRANATLFLLGSTAICGLPPLNGFVSEFLIYTGLLRLVYGSPLVVAATATVAIAALAMIGGLAMLAFSKLFAVMFLGEPRDPSVHIHQASRPMVWGMGLLAGCCLLVAFGASPMVKLIVAPVHQLVPVGFDVAGLSIIEASRSLLLVSGFFLLLSGTCLLLTIVRRQVGTPVTACSDQPTWGCGFAAPSARMQYTGSSYVWNLLNSFQSVARVQRLLPTKVARFADLSDMRTEATDGAVRWIYQPLFKHVGRACDRLWPLQHGRIQLYLVYVVVTVVVAFIIEFGFAPFEVRPIASGDARRVPAHRVMAGESPYGDAHSP